MKGRLIQFWSEERSLTLLLILIIVDIFFVTPTTRIGYALELIETAVFSLLLFAGLFTMARHRIFQAVSGVFIVSTIGVRLARSVAGVAGLLQWDALLSILSVVGMVTVVLWQVYREGPVTGHRVRGAIAAYLLIAMLFGYGYALISYLIPGAFQLPAWVSGYAAERIRAFYYFSVVTLTTLGYGDITAIHPLARSLVMIEALIGQLYPAILIARLVTLELETRRSGKG